MSIDAQLSLSIEVALSEDESTTAKGNRFEDFISSFLEGRGFDVEQRLRVTGMEIDLLAKERVSGERVYIECKAQKENLPASVISQAFGNASLRGYSRTWVITTSELSKDARGIRSEWEEKEPGERRKLAIFDGRSLLKELIDSKIIADPAVIRSSTGVSAQKAVLLVTDLGLLWAFAEIDVDTGLTVRVLTFDAASQKSISDNRTLQALKGLGTSLQQFEWTPPSSERDRIKAETIRAESQSIIEVLSGEDWADYRPARPDDYIGRKTLLSEMCRFLEDVRTGATRTKIFALKAPSGWGKSSTVVKLRSWASAKRSSSRHFVFAVDCRSASSNRFVELALWRALQRAREAKFLDEGDLFAHDAFSKAFDLDFVARAAEQLRARGKLVTIVFDQFEEFFSKDELFPVFDEMRKWLFAIDQLDAGISIGFCWKTDTSFPGEHPAYHMWHALADRRREFELKKFTKPEVLTAISKFEAQIGERLLHPLRRVLLDHCQGYPWLLKKLCIHIADLIAQGGDQSDIYEKALSVKDLFDAEVQRLSAIELSCVKRIADLSPAEYFVIRDEYGEDVINELIHKRILVRTGLRLTLYWDIFALGLAWKAENGGISTTLGRFRSPEQAARVRFLQTRIGRFCADFLQKRPTAGGKELGKVISEYLGAEWSDASCMRYGAALRRWTIWSHNNMDFPTTFTRRSEAVSSARD
jgi:hypothetical protein